MYRNRQYKIVGRICGLINHSYNKKWNQTAIRFTRFDFIDDYEVSKALFTAVSESVSVCPVAVVDKQLTIFSILAFDKRGEY